MYNHFKLYHFFVKSNPSESSLLRRFDTINANFIEGNEQNPLLFSPGMC